MTGINKRSNQPSLGQKKDRMLPSGYSSAWVDQMDEDDRKRRANDAMSPAEKRAAKMRARLRDR